jgi:hypothetical protein
MDRDDGIPRVVLAAEQRGLLEALEAAPERCERVVDFLDVVVRGDREELLELLDLRGEALVALEPPAQAGVFGRERGRALLVAPEARSPHRVLELRDPGSECIRVKGNHGPRRAGP